MNRFCYVRKDKRVPYDRLAEQTSISGYILSLVEKGRFIPTQDQASRIGQALGIPDATPEKLLEEVIPVTAPPATRLQREVVER